MDTPEKTARFDDQMLRRERILGFGYKLFRRLKG